jgi:hypothetical protein
MRPIFWAIQNHRNINLELCFCHVGVGGVGWGESLCSLHATIKGFCIQMGFDSRAMPNATSMIAWWQQGLLSEPLWEPITSTVTGSRKREDGTQIVKLLPNLQTPKIWMFRHTNTFTYNANSGEGITATGPNVTIFRINETKGWKVKISERTLKSHLRPHTRGGDSRPSPCA